MERALWSAVTGMRAQALSMDTIAHNLANVNTSGFKAGRINFQDMLYSVLATPGAESGNARLPTGIQIGHGTRVSEISKDFRQGPLKDTGRDLDIAIEGEGFFTVIMPDGESAYTRDGSFHVTADGDVVTVDGYKVEGFDKIDSGTTELTIAADGAFTAVVSGQERTKAPVTLTLFINPDGLRAMGRNLFQETTASGSPQAGIKPGENGAGSLAQHYLEGSNVNAAEEMVNMIVSQRAYEAVSKAIRASDDMMEVANGLRR
jgi:flagellar basal-body rod protein FlgG